MKEGKRSSSHSPQSTFKRSIRPSIQFPASYTGSWRPRSSRIEERQTGRQAVLSLPLTVTPFQRFPAERAKFCVTVVARAYIRMTTAKGWQNGRRSVMRKLPRAIKSRGRRRCCKYHLFPSLSRARVMQLTWRCIMHERLHQHRWSSRFSRRIRELDKGVTRGCYEISFACVHSHDHAAENETPLLFLCSRRFYALSIENYIDSKSTFSKSLKSNFILNAFLDAHLDGYIITSYLLRKFLPEKNLTKRYF